MSATCTTVRDLLFLWLVCIYSTIYLTVAVCTEGSLQLSGSASGGRQFLQVCHIQEWRYVCNWKFDDTIDKEVVLQQLGCKTGDTSTDWLNNENARELAERPCIGVERMLIDCPRYLELNPRNCYYKVTVKCNNNSQTTRQCLNGQLTRSVTNVLYLCVSGEWEKLCSNLWGNLQESVACRQLSQETPSQYYYGDSDEYFKHYIHCTGQENKIADCKFTTSVEDDDCTILPVKLLCSKVNAPVNMSFTSISSSSVVADWTQPSSDSVQYYTNHTITCTSTHGVYTAVTQHINVSAAVNVTMHTIITGLTANTSYNCCVSVYSDLGKSEDGCGSVTTEKYMESTPIISTIVQSCSVTSDLETIQAGLRTQASVMNRPTSVMTEAQCEQMSSPIPWVAGIIIGAVLSAVILVTVIVAVYLWRKKAQSLNKMSDSSTERRVSLNQTNQCYSSVQEPQDYEEFQPNGQDPQPAAADGVYSYADHSVNTNSVPQTNESSDCYKDVTVVDNTALYSLCEQDNGSTLN